jgi:hypothetical protein
MSVLSSNTSTGIFDIIQIEGERARRKCGGGSRRAVRRRWRHGAADLQETSSVSPMGFGRFLPVSAPASTSFRRVEIVYLFCALSPH